jgi:hypothetical protein
MNDSISNRFTAGILLVVLAGFWLTLAPYVPGVQGLPNSWRPVFLSKAFAPAPASAPRPAQRVNARKPAPASQEGLNLAKADVSAGSAAQDNR